MGFGWRPPPQEDEDMAGEKKQDAGKSEMIVLRHPTNGSVRTVTKDEWKEKEAQYLAEGFAPPSELQGDK
jgi:hypothetical protein